MSVGILLVTHGKLGHFLLDTLNDLLQPESGLPLNADVLEVRRVQAHDVLITQGSKMIERLDCGDGVLIITDAFGSTPSNIANKLGAIHPRTQVVAGINLPMLVSVFNYPQLSLPDMAKKAVESGQRGIIHCPRPNA